MGFRLIFVTGTDTGVGKTLVACALVRALRARGVDAVGFKPVATGSEGGRWLDAEALREAGGGTAPLDLVCPLRFRAPLAPHQAALRERRRIDLGVAWEALRELRKRHEFVVLEGVGGLLTPLGAHTAVLDFLRRAGGPAVLVARAGLGTVNHTLLSLRELFRAGAPLAGVVLNVTRREDAANVLPSRREIERLSGVRVSVVLPFLPAARGGAGARELRAARLLRPVAERWLRQGAR